jgi:hypothetical protein
MTNNLAKQRKPAKPLPPDPEQRNDQRAQSADAALLEFRRLTGAGAGDAVSDLLADLLHWCDRHGQDFDAELRHGRNHYEVETEI